MKPIEVIIETVAGTAVKYKYDPQCHSFMVKKILPLGMVFPYDFGFLPGTIGSDGDPLDGLVISSNRTFTGAHVWCRLIGAILATQSGKGKNTRNDRFIFVPVDDVVFEHIKTLQQFGKKHNQQLKDFFINYNKAENKNFNPVKIISPSQAFALVQKSHSPPAGSNQDILPHQSPR